MPENEKRIPITVKYTADQATVEVEPDVVTIHYNFDKVPEKSTVPRHVRWVAYGVKKGDHVVVRPKETLETSIKSILKPEGKERFECTYDEPTVGTKDLNFSERPSTLPLKWKYDAVVLRGDMELGVHDPIILIDKDP